jgi:DNA-directed RNA polymerase specialized sigma24 family protein
MVSLQEPEMEAVADNIPALQFAASETGAAMDVEAMLWELPEKYRRVITLFYLEQKGYEEVAAMLGIPLGTVKTFLFRAKKEMLKIGSRRPRMISDARSFPEPKPRQSATGSTPPSFTGFQTLPNLILL